MTNYERIKAMSVEEMAGLIGDIQTDALLFKGIINDLMESQRIKREAKTEAYKEFAARLKSYLLLNEKGSISVISFENIDDLLKEMIGEEWLNGDCLWCHCDEIIPAKEYLKKEKEKVMRNYSTA